MTSRDNLNNDILSNLLESKNLTYDQLQQIKSTIDRNLKEYQLEPVTTTGDSMMRDIQQENAMILRDFINAKRVEGRSSATLYGYAKEISRLSLTINKHFRDMTSNDVRDYMAYRKETNNLTQRTVGNIRMYLMSFFKWCLLEDVIKRNPMDRIGTVKVEQRVVQTLTDEEQEVIRAACSNERERAIIDLLSSSGMRVSELCNLNIEDVNFETGEVRVMGKGNKERICFLNGRAKVHLKWYIESRTDNHPALFVNAKEPHNRITRSGIEFILRNIAKRSKIPTIKLYPHKYRSTLATNMINKGANAEHVQGILGHSNVNTTLQCYCKVDKQTYKNAHKRFG